MPRTIQCINCGITLNLPKDAAGRRLKCPKCGAKFQATQADLNAASTAPGVSDARFDSLSGLVPVPADLQALIPAPAVTPHDVPVPTAPGDLRSTFDLPMMTEAAEGGSSRSREVADATALFEQKRTPKRLVGAEARAQTRKCPTCKWVVPPGTSICQSCGLDLDTGTRVELDYDVVQE